MKAGKVPAVLNSLERALAERVCLSRRTGVWGGDVSHSTKVQIENALIHACLFLFHLTHL